MNMAKYLEEKGKTQGIAEGREEGREEGRAEGEASGEARAKRATAINLLKEGADPEFVAKVTGLALEDVKSLQGSSAD